MGWQDSRNVPRTRGEETEVGLLRTQKGLREDELNLHMLGAIAGCACSDRSIVRIQQRCVLYFGTSRLRDSSNLYNFEEQRPLGGWGKPWLLLVIAGRFKRIAIKRSETQVLRMHGFSTARKYAIENGNTMSRKTPE